MKIKTGDKVKILSGKDAGKEGKIIQVFKEREKVVVEGVNLIKKHMRPRQQGEKGQVIELAGPVHASKVMLICPKCGRGARIKFKLEAGDKRRVCGKCGESV